MKLGGKMISHYLLSEILRQRSQSFPKGLIFLLSTHIKNDSMHISYSPYFDTIQLIDDVGIITVFLFYCVLGSHKMAECAYL